MSHHTAGTIIVSLAAMLLPLACSAPAGPVITVRPAVVIEGEPVAVTITGLKPAQTVVLHACRMWDAYPTGSEAYRGRSVFVADGDGSIDLKTAIPQIGSGHDQADPSGPFWSMKPVRAGDSLVTPAECDPSTLRSGEVVLEAEADGAIVARTVAVLATTVPGVTITEVRTPNVVGVFATAENATSRPAVIILGGSEGGLFTGRSLAPIFASHGFATLGVGYFRRGEPALESLASTLELIPVETVDNARRWLAEQPSVDAGRIAVVGVSKGAELALLAAATYDWIDLVAAFAPSHVVWEGMPPTDRTSGRAESSWTLEGNAVPFVRWSLAAEARNTEARKPAERSRLTEVHLESLAEFAGDVEQATIAIERSRAALLLVAGIDDGMWPAAYSVERLQARLARHHYDRPVKVVLLPTGHQVLGTGWAPTTAFQRDNGRLQGGSARLDAHAQARVWPQLLAFLHDGLR